MNLALVFSTLGKTNAKNIIFHMVLRKFFKNTNNKLIFSANNIFYKYKTSFFQSVFNYYRKSQIRNNVVCVVARLVIVFCCTLTTGRCDTSQHVLVNQKKLWPMIPGYVTCRYKRL